MTSESFNQVYEEVLLSLLRRRIHPKAAIAKRYYRLPFQEQVAIALRYWGNSTIEEIAESLEISWDEADQLLAAAEVAIKNELLAELNIKVLPQRPRPDRKGEQSV